MLWLTSSWTNVALGSKALLVLKGGDFTTVLNHPQEIKKVPNGPLLPLNQFNIIGLPCKISKYYNWGILRKNYFCVLQWGYFHPAMHFQEVFGRYL